jgi:hypothetical protein
MLAIPPSDSFNIKLCSLPLYWVYVWQFIYSVQKYFHNVSLTTFHTQIATNVFLMTCERTKKSLVVLDAKHARIVSMKMELLSKVTLLLGPSWTLKSLFYLQFEGSPKSEQNVFWPSLVWPSNSCSYTIWVSPKVSIMSLGLSLTL